MDKLTPKEELFCTLVAVEGLSQRQAYRETYATNASDEVVDVAASRLSKKTKVRLRSQELRAALVSPSIADRKERMELWSDIARDAGEKTADRLRATELLGKAQGDFIERTENKNLNVYGQLDRLEVLTDDQIDELLAIIEDKMKALLNQTG